MEFSHPDYSIIKEIGQGASATVLLAIEKNLNRRVALKIVEHRNTNEAGLRRFRREARILACLNHPNIVPIYAMSEIPDSATSLMVMRYIDGGTLRERMHQMTLADSLRVIIEIAGALEYAHRNGFLHRDVKPQNILFDGDRAMLVDFGIARAEESKTYLTKTGATLGTPDYMSPEQVNGGTLDARSDLYSLGIVLYEMLSGTLPFDANSAITTGVMQLTTPAPPLPTNLASFQPCIDSLLAKNPRNRPENATALIAQLNQLRDELHLPFDEPIAIIRGEVSPVATAPLLATPERRQLTVLSAEIVDYAKLSSVMDPEDLHEATEIFRQVLQTNIFRFRGHVAQFKGGGFLAYFGYPAAHEDDATRAILAGLEITNAIVAHAHSSTTQRREPNLDVRIGINTGPVVFANTDGDVFKEQLATGETPILAESIQRAGEINSVTVAESTKKIATGGFEFAALASQDSWGDELKSRSLFKVVGLVSTETRFSATRGSREADLVGRKKEFRDLNYAWASTLSSGGRLVLITGDAGIGKSCLVNSLLNKTLIEKFPSIVYQCSPYYTDTALYPALQHLSHAAGLHQNDSPETNLQRLDGVLSLPTSQMPEALAVLAPLLSIDATGLPNLEGRFDSPQQRREYTLSLFVDQMLSTASKTPLLFVVEDAHWIDPTSLALIEMLLNRIEEQKILCVITTRPPFNPAFMDHSLASHLSVGRLSETSIMEIVANTAGENNLPKDMIKHVIAKTDGVPLFAEELTKTLLETMQIEGIDQHETGSRLNQLTIPSSLHDSLVARLDRMQPVKSVVQAAACIGREFSFSVLNKISPMVDAELVKALNQLERAGLIYKQTVPYETGYLFKHALVRDAAYDSLLKSQRRSIHADLFLKLQSIPNTSPEILAYHATRAEQFIDAVEYWERAADNATDRASFTEAIGHYQRGRECAAKAPKSEQTRTLELTMLVKQGHASTALNGFAHPVTVNANRAARQLLDEAGESEYRFPILYGHWVITHALGSHKIAIVDATELQREAERNDDRVQRITAYRTLAASQTMMGEFRQALANFDNFYSLYDACKDRDLAWQYGLDFSVSARTNHAFTLICCGETEKSLALVENLYTYSLELRHSNTLAYTLAHLAFIGVIGRMKELNKYIELGNEYVDEHDLIAYKGHCRGIRAMYHYEQGDFERSFHDMSVSLGIISQTKTNIYTPLLYACHSACLAELGRFPASMEAAHTALALVETGNEYWALGEIKRLIAVAHSVRNGLHERVEELFFDAVNDANMRGARLWALRTGVSFAKALIDDNQQERAIEIVTGVVRDFPNSSTGSPDLAEAERILNLSKK